MCIYKGQSSAKFFPISFRFNTSALLHVKVLAAFLIRHQVQIPKTSTKYKYKFGKHHLFYKSEQSLGMPYQESQGTVTKPDICSCLSIFATC